jgi:hypothetical protein
MIKKVGIITIYSVYNYGAMLQAYALSKYIESIGYDSEIIDYRPYALCRDYDFYWKDLLLDPRNALGTLKQSMTKRKQFIRFKDFLKKDIPTSLTRYGHSDTLKSHNYDILVTGSDQIWNPYITSEDENFLLSFDSGNAKKISYSSSFGVSDIPIHWADKVKVALNKFNQLGVREESGVKIINGLLELKNVNLVLDPVFLIPVEYWRKLSNNSLTPKIKYLLVYSLEVNEKIMSYAISLAKVKGLKIVTIHPFKSDYDFADICINEAGPKEFISLIDNAEFIVTNSFHGTVFSIILNKKFSCVLHTKTGTRMSNLLERIGLDTPNIFLSKDNVKIPFYEMNTQSNMKLKKHIEFSKSCLILDKF